MHNAKKIKIYIIHGWDGTPDEPMLSWLKSSIEELGAVEVIAPFMPNPEKPNISSWTSLLEEEMTENDTCIFISHSIGCQAVLRFIEKTKKSLDILGLVLIAPWLTLDEQTLIDDGEEVRERSQDRG
jgi:hypothetical protein